MILVKLLIELNKPKESVITDDDIVCNEKRLHSKIVNIMCSSGRETITFLDVVVGSQFVV